MQIFQYVRMRFNVHTIKASYHKSNDVFAKEAIA